MQRLLPALAAFALVFAGVGGAILLLASRDHSSLEAAPAGGAAATTAGGAGPYGLPAGNVVVSFSAEADRIRIDRLAERLGAIDTDAARATGQALVSRAGGDPGRVVATNGPASETFDDATDPRLAAFVRQYLGRTP